MFSGKITGVSEIEVNLSLLSKYLVVPQPLQCEAVLPTLQSVVGAHLFLLILRRTSCFSLDASDEWHEYLSVDVRNGV